MTLQVKKGSKTRISRIVGVGWQRPHGTWPFNGGTAAPAVEPSVRWTDPFQSARAAITGRRSSRTPIMRIPNLAFLAHFVVWASVMSALFTMQIASLAAGFNRGDQTVAIGFPDA